MFSSLSMLSPLSRTYFALMQYCVHVSKIVQKITSLQLSLSLRIGFCSVSRNYTVWCEHTFPSIFMFGMNLKTLNIVLMCFDRKKQPLEKKNKRKYNNNNNKRMSKALKIDFVLSDDEIQFLHSLAHSNFDCYCSRSALLISPF